MAALSVVCLDSPAELRRRSASWDELWQRSTVTLPTARASLVANWCEAFAGKRQFRAFIVQRDGQAVAALPLVGGRVLGMPVGELPTGHWSAAGDLLLDPTADAGQACGALLRAIKSTWPLLWFDTIASDRSHWRSFLQVCREHQLTPFLQPRFTIDTVRVGHDWNAYLQTRTRNHRRHVRKALYAAERQGSLELTTHDELHPDRLEGLLRQCFEIEAGGWKGETRGAVLQAPGVWEFYLAQAKQLAAWGQLRLTVLAHSGQPIAFEYGWKTRGVYCTPKVSYDEAFSRFSPGQLLRFLLFERLEQQADLDWIDFFGPTSTASSRWGTDSYPISRVVVPLGSPISRVLVGACRHAWPVARRLRRAAKRVPQGVAEAVAS